MVGVGIKNRLNRSLGLLLVMFALISVGLYYGLLQISKNIDRIVEERFQQVVENSRNSRDFGLLHARIQVYKQAFYGNEQFAHAESRILTQDLGQLKERLHDPGMRAYLKQLETEFRQYVEHCEWVNVLLSWRSGQEEDINEQLLILQEIIADRTIEVSVAGGDVGYLEQLTLLVSGYRENMLEIASRNARAKRSDLLRTDPGAPPALENPLDDLILRMQALTASEPPINKFGRHLISRLRYYQYLIYLHQLEIGHLQEQNQSLETYAASILTALEESDRQTVAEVGETRTLVRQNISSMFALVLGLLSLLSALFWFNYRSFFRLHIQIPMHQISSRLQRFQQGDHSSPLVLRRKDEWGEVEEIFNQVLDGMNRSVAKLRDSERRYREIFTNATEGIFRVSLSGQLLEANPAMVKILGYESREELLAVVTDLGTLHYVDKEMRKDMIARLYREGQMRHFECQLQRRDGEQFWASINNRVIRNERGEILHIEGTMQDISIQKRALQSLQTLQDYLQNIIDSMPSILIGVDAELKVTLWNKGAEEVGGLAAGSVIGQPFADVFRLFAPDVYLGAVKATLSSRQPTRLHKLESRQETEEGDTNYFDMLIYPLSVQEDSGIAIYIDDITERVRFEQMLVRSEKMQSVGSLAAGLAHEINNPLAAILQNVQVLSHRISPSLQKNRSVAAEIGTSIEMIEQYCQERGFDKMLQAISSAGQRAAKIVETMQTFSRGGEQSFAPSSLEALLERTIELACSDYDMRHHFDFHKIRLVRDFQPVGQIRCEPSQIQQVILSLLKNAAQALHEHSDGQAAPQLTLKISPALKDRVVLQIRDNGSGMNAEQTRRIFDPFYSTRKVGSGSGLGLSVAYFIVTQNHQGELTVTSEPGHGTCFEMVLPLLK